MPSADVAAGEAGAAARRSSRSSRTRQAKPQARPQPKRLKRRPSRQSETLRPRRHPTASRWRRLQASPPMARPTRRMVRPASPQTKRSRRPAPKPSPEPPVTTELPAVEAAQASVDAAEAPSQAGPVMADQHEASPVDDGEDQADAAPIDGDEEAPADETAPATLPDDRPRRRGWWQRIASSSR